MRNLTSKVLMWTITLIIGLSSFYSPVVAQNNYRIGCVGFYNLENLFDLEDDPNIRDDEFTPTGKNLWTKEKYVEKMGHIADVLSEIGTNQTPDGLAIIGVSEIENRKVLEDLVKEPKLLDRNYKIVHFDSPDKRGIDVGMLYQPKYFKPTNTKKIPFDFLRTNGDTVFTRDILLVEGIFDGDPMAFLINHWPSRSGGEAASRYLRNHSAELCKAVIDSLEAINPMAKVVLLGDLNDDPDSPSVKNYLSAVGKAKKVKKGNTYNPMFDFYKKGLGTTAYRDAWSLFDQVILTRAFLRKNQTGYRFYQANIHNPRYMVQKSGRYKGYPFRTFAGGSYLGGYSDHFPVYVALVKQI